MKAKMNIRGNEMFEQLQAELDFPFKRTGSLVLCLNEEDLPELEKLRQRGIVNGVTFLLDTECMALQKHNQKFILTTNKGAVESKLAITAFAGLRAHEESDDFIIGESEDVRGLINVVSIESPGLTSAPAIGEYVKNIVKFATAMKEQRKALIKQDKRYGKIVCRCENVTEAEIVQAIKAPLGAKTIDAIKKRTRAGMGRCQAGFCMNRVIEILSDELHISLEQVTKSGGTSQVLLEDIKEKLETERENV